MPSSLHCYCAVLLYCSNFESPHSSDRQTPSSLLRQWSSTPRAAVFSTLRSPTGTAFGFRLTAPRDHASTLHLAVSAVIRY